MAAAAADDDNDDDDDKSRRPPPATPPIVVAVAHRLADDDGDNRAAPLLDAIISRICAMLSFGIAANNNMMFFLERLWRPPDNSARGFFVFCAASNEIPSKMAGERKILPAIPS